MTLAEQIQMLKDLSAYDLSNFGYVAAGTITDAAATAQLNTAQRRISRIIEQFDHSIVTTLVDGTARYLSTNTAVFAKKIIKPAYVVINGNPLYQADGKAYGMWTLAEIQRYNPTFRTDTTTGTPTRAVWDGLNITLNVPPSATVVSAANNYVAGTIYATDQNSSNTSATSDMVAVLHEAVCVKAAVWGALSTTSEAQGWQRLMQLDQWADAEIASVRNDNLNAINDWGSTQGYHVPDYMTT